MEKSVRYISLPTRSIRKFSVVLDSDVASSANIDETKRMFSKGCMKL
jgi:hypothetical protein